MIRRWVTDRNGNIRQIRGLDCFKRNGIVRLYDPWGKDVGTSSSWAVQEIQFELFRTKRGQDEFAKTAQSLKEWADQKLNDLEKKSETAEGDQ